MSQARFRRLFSISVFIFVLLVCVYLFLHSAFFKVEKVYVTGASKVSQEEILNLAGIKPGQNIFMLNTDLAVKAVKIHPMIKSADVIRHLPHQVEIKVSERQIWALIPDPPILLCVDDEGVCIDRLNTFSLMDYPIITMDRLPERVNLGQSVNPDAVRQIKKVHDAIGDEQKKISEYHYSNSNKEIILYTEEGTKILFGSLDRLDAKVANLKTALAIEEEVQKDGHQVLDYVDLRFEGQPVVKTRD